METTVILFLSVIITVYPLMKLDNYMMINKIYGSENKYIRITQKTISFIFAIAWFIFSCYLAVKIYRLVESLISSI